MKYYLKLILMYSINSFCADHVMDVKKIEQPKDLISAKKYVINTFLSAQEKALIANKKKCFANSVKAYQVIMKVSKFLANEVARLQLIEDSNEAKNEFANKFLKDEIEKLTD